MLEKFKLFQQMLCTVLIVFQPVAAGNKLHMLCHGKIGIKGRNFRDIADLTTAGRKRVLLTVDQYFSFRGQEHRGHHADGGVLPKPVVEDNADNFAILIKYSSQFK